MTDQVTHVYKFGPFHLDTREHVLLRDGRPVPLPPKVFDTLAVLVQNSGHIVAKDELMKTVWPDSFVEEANLAQNIFTLRKVLGENPRGQQYIETVPKRGYRFVVTIEELGEETATPEVGEQSSAPLEHDEVMGRAAERDRERLRDAQTNPFSTTVSSSLPVPLPHSVTRPWRVNRFVLTLPVALIGLLWLYFLTKPDRGIDSLAVLPFVNETADPSTEYLSDGISESLINSLSQLPKLRVPARTTVFRYKGQAVDPNKVGRELRVRAVLTGRVVQQRDTLSIQVELVNAADGAQLWGDKYTRKLADIFAVQDEVANQILEKLRLKLTGEEQELVTKRYTENAEAYQLYLKGRFYWNKYTEAGFRKAIEYFDQAVEKDPNYALAYVGLADCYIGLGTDFLSPREAIPKARAYVVKALELNETLAEAHASLGIVKLLYDWDWPAAEKELRHNLGLSPRSVETFSCSLHYADAMGRNDEAIAEIKRALELDPLSLPANLELGCASYYGRQYDQAIKQFRETLTMDSNSPLSYLGIGRAYGQKKMYQEAIAELSKGKTISGDWPPIVAELAYAYGASGKKAEARRLLQELREQTSRRYVDPYLMAMVFVGLSDKEQAFAWLDKAYDERSGWLPWLKVEPKWDILRTDARFTVLLRRIGFAL